MGVEGGALGGGEQSEVEAAGVVGGEAMVAEGDKGAVLADERTGAGGEMEIAGAVAGAVAQQQPEGGGDGGVVEGGEFFEREVGELGRAVGGGDAHERRGGDSADETGAGGAGGGHGRLGCQRIVGGRAGLAFDEGEAGDFFQGGELFVGDMTVVDEFLGEIHQLGGRGEGVADGECVFEGEKPLIKTKTD